MYSRAFVIIAKRFEHYSKVPIACCLSISVVNFYLNNKSFLQVFSGLLVFAK